METSLTTICNEIEISDRKDTAKELYRFFRTVTPQFYKNQSEQEIKQTLASIQLLTASIPLNRLAEMCRIAVMDYPSRKAENPNCYFNLDYLLSFRDQAKRNLHPAGYLVILDYNFQTGVTTYGDIDYLDSNFNYPDDAPRYYEAK